jgi:NTE family protein
LHLESLAAFFPADQDQHQEQMMESSVRARFIGISFVLLLSMILSVASAAQDVSAAAAPAHRPRIGLALSGGGALGLTEIGVIQWMEDNHIPVDRIAGTSMGSIIGAMYATGMTPVEIRAFAEKINWEQALLPEPPYADLSFRRKQDRRDFLINAPLGLKHGLHGPNGYNPGQGVGLLLDRIAFPESGISSFDELPIPFHCVATDMQSGEAIVLRDGPLGEAVRASMAIPGVFTPVEIKGRMLADGGMVQNIPVETVKAMDADVVIAVELSLPPGDIAQLGSLVGVLSRAVDVMIMQNERQSLALADAKISVDMKGFWVNDYSRVDELIQLGYRTAASESAHLMRYAIQDPAEWRHYLDERAARKRSPLKKVDAIEVTGGGPDVNRRIEHQLSKDIGGPIDLPVLEKQLTKIAGQGQFDDLGYEGFVQNGVPSLRVTAHEKTYGPPFVDLAVNVDGSGVAAYNFSAGARVTFMDVAHRGGEWRNDLLFGSSNLVATEFYQPIAQSRFFVSPYAFASKFGRNSFTGLTRVAIFGDERAGGGFDLGYNSGLRSELRIGYELFDGKLSPLVGAAGLPIVHGSTGEFRGRFVWDGQDSPSVPGKGTRIVATLARVLQSPGVTSPITQLEVQTSNVFALGSKTSLFFDASGGTTFRGNAGPFQVFELGGPFHLGAYFPYEFFGNHYAYASLGFRRELYRLPQLIGKKVYWGGWYEAGTAFGVPGNDPGPVVVRGTFNLGIIADTMVGPITIAGSVSPTGQSRINFSIGRIF